MPRDLRRKRRIAQNEADQPGPPRQSGPQREVSVRGHAAAGNSPNHRENAEMLFARLAGLHLPYPSFASVSAGGGESGFRRVPAYNSYFSSRHSILAL